MEMNWGVHDVLSLEKYKGNLLGSRIAIPRMLQLFNDYEIHATWAIVGMLYCKNKKELLQRLDNLDLPYEQEEFSPKHILSYVGEEESVDPYHYASSLIEIIKVAPNQEIATHTFSHYYCLESGQSIKNFEKDLENVAELQEGVTSLVFPRNQTNEEYLKVCKMYGISAYRGNEDSWIYRPYTSKTNLPIKRAMRLLDAYIMVTGHHTYSINSIKATSVLNIKSSRFLRPYNKKLRVLEGLRLERIKKGLTEAAREDKVFHLWWHPHNFGVNIEENLRFLEKILKHVEILRDKYSFESLNMKEVADKFLAEQREVDSIT